MRFIAKDPHWNISSMFYIDPSGNVSMPAAKIFGFGWKLCSEISNIDGVAPYAEAIGLGIGVGLTVVAGIKLASDAISDKFSGESKSKTKKKE